MGSVFGGIGAAVGGIANAFGASSAASDQEQAANNNLAFQQQELAQITQQEAPFLQAGQGAQGSLNQLLGIGADNGSGGYGSLLQPFTASDMAQYSPQYNFVAQQGRQGVLNGDSSGAGALSGAAQKDLINYNQNAANTAYNSAFQNYQTQQGNIYSRLAGVSQLGQNAASNTGAQGTQLAGNEGSAATNYGNAAAAGITGVTQALGEAATNTGALLAANPNLFSGGGGNTAGNYYGAGGANPYGAT